MILIPDDPDVSEGDTQLMICQLLQGVGTITPSRISQPRLMTVLRRLQTVHHADKIN